MGSLVYCQARFFLRSSLRSRGIHESRIRIDTSNRKVVHEDAHRDYRGSQKSFRLSQLLSQDQCTCFISHNASSYWARAPFEQSPFYESTSIASAVHVIIASPPFSPSLPRLFLLQPQIHHRPSNALVHAATNIPQHPHSKVSARVSQGAVVRSPGHCQHGYCLRG
jgi:hypothetical protein